MLKEEKRVVKYLEKLADSLEEEENSIILEGFNCLKHVVDPENYSEVVQELIISLLTRKGEGKEVSLDAIINDAVMKVELNMPNEDRILRIKEVNERDMAYNKDEVTRQSAVSRVYEGLKCSKSLQNQVFLDELSGIDRNVIARKYRLTRAEVDSICTERLGFVKSILIINDDILIEEVESRGPIKSNVKMLTDNKKNNINE